MLRNGTGCQRDVHVGLGPLQRFQGMAFKTGCCAARTSLSLMQRHYKLESSAVFTLLSSLCLTLFYFPYSHYLFCHNGHYRKNPYYSRSKDLADSAVYHTKYMSPVVYVQDIKHLAHTPKKVHTTCLKGKPCLFPVAEESSWRKMIKKL